MRISVECQDNCALWYFSRSSSCYSGTLLSREGNLWTWNCLRVPHKNPRSVRHNPGGPSHTCCRCYSYHKSQRSMSLIAVRLSDLCSIWSDRLEGTWRSLHGWRHRTNAWSLKVGWEWVAKIGHTIVTLTLSHKYNKLWIILKPNQKEALILIFKCLHRDSPLLH